MFLRMSDWDSIRENFSAMEKKMLNEAIIDSEKDVPWWRRLWAPGLTAGRTAT